MQGQRLVFISQNCFIQTLKALSFALGSGSFLCQVIDTKYHILGRNGNRAAIGGLQQVIG